MLRLGDHNPVRPHLLEGFPLDITFYEEPTFINQLQDLLILYNLLNVSAIQCEEGFIYRPCVDPCQELDCGEVYKNETCQHACVEGCGCREDQILFEGNNICSFNFVLQCFSKIVK